MRELTVRLSPDGAWLVAAITDTTEVSRLSMDVPQTGPWNVVVNDVPVVELAGERLVRCRLDDDREPETIYLATESDGRMYEVIVLDDGTVIGIRRDGLEISEWRSGVPRRDRPLFDRPGMTSLHLRPDGRQLVIIHGAWDDEDSDIPMTMHALDLDTWTLDRLSELQSHVVLGWTRDLSQLLAYDAEDLVRIDLRSGQREVLVSNCLPSGAASAAWIACSHGRRFIRIPTEPDGKPTAVPTLDGMQPVLALDDNRFLCATADRYVIADLGRDLGNVTAALLPPLSFSYSAALGALVSTRDDVCEIWSLDGALQKTITF